VTAQPEPPAQDRRVRPLPRTINAVGEALTGAKRALFYGEVLAAEEGEPINTVLRKWWREAMFDSRPGRDQRLADAAAGRNLVPLPAPAGEEA
jgi:hypothetical protein